MGKLRCWPGCLAIVIRSNCGNEGREVECVRFVRADDELPEFGRWVIADNDGWVVKAKRPMNVPPPVIDASIGYFSDDWLMPLKPGTGAEVETVADVIEAARGVPVEG
jgi:hypothetical protein